jgi:uncharacterized protein YegL
MMIVDGDPTDDWEAAAQRIKEAENSKSVIFYPIGTDRVDMKKLSL